MVEMSESAKKTSFQELIDEGDKLAKGGQHKEAIKIFKLALIMSKNLEKNDIAGLHIRLANAYHKIDDRDKYTYHYEAYLELFPQGQQSIFSRLAHSYFYIDSDKSIDYHNKALNIGISKYDSACKLFAMTKSSYYEQQDIKDESEYEVEQIRNNLFKNIKKYTWNKKDLKQDKKLTIGYFSSDCHAHTMMNYILPIWENHNKDKFNFVLFNGSEKDDSTTERIKKIGFKIVPIAKLNESELAKVIYENNVDILVDLGGYTHLRSYVHFYKPAPIIISYLGYLNTLGMKDVDYILTDRFSIPEDKKYLYTEKPLYMESGYQIFMEKNLPELTTSPYKTNGYITFGSFNCTSKFNDATIYMWAKILKEVPESRLLIYRTQLTRKIMKHLREKLEQRGIPSERLIFSAQKYDVHFKAYSLADISLDPYPFGGMSIAIETALMGVPTITLMGDGLQSRGAARINKSLNLEELNALCGDNYIQNAVDLSNNKQKLDELRTSLRDKIINSNIMSKHKEFTQELENNFLKVWKDFISSP